MVNISGTGAVKLNFVDGYIRELIDINASQQLYYSYDIQMMREFQEAREALQVNVEEREQIDPDRMIKFIQKYHHSLSVKTELSITEEEAKKYAFVTLAIYILEDAYVLSMSSHNLRIDSLDYLST
ncbi:hypothetical protein [Paenibacillus sp. FSL H7-0331]|uniref:hypothetical protein n=1 Tax=Paenibacillus sp. FSL H7-0331 TaxID=1920421 RepID=UPI00096BF409|nr:hypothetical protein [Paenibacillus sp. FSL H7-0331]OME99248.1 hypothetical protein BK127_38810 [Paenibacillus sp. FSL H7-0331]